MRTVGIPVGSPMPAQDDNQQSAIYCSSIAHLGNSVPPKECRCVFSKVRGRLPQSFLSPQSKSLPDLPFYPSCSGWHLAMSVPRVPIRIPAPIQKLSNELFQGFRGFGISTRWVPKVRFNWSNSCLVSLSYIHGVRTNDNQSPRIDWRSQLQLGRKMNDSCISVRSNYRLLCCGRPFTSSSMSAVVL